MDTLKEPQSAKIKTVEKVLMLLEILAQHNGPLPLTRIVQLSKLSFSTTYRLMNTLWKNGYVERDNETDYYKLGLKAFLIGNAALRNIELRPIALPYLNQLSQNCGESVFLAILSGQNVIYPDCIKTSSPIQFGIQTGVLLPACYTSSGKLLISNLPLSEQQALAEIYIQNRQISDKEKFLEELKLIKSQGFCSGINGLGRMIFEISVPIYNYLKNYAGAISIFKLTNNDESIDQTENLINHIKNTSVEISFAMGYSL